MLDDVLTSSRGPGVIGTLLAVLVLGGFSGLALMVLNSDEGIQISDEEKILGNKEELISLAEKTETQLARLNMYRVRREKITEMSRISSASDRSAQELARERASIDRVQLEVQNIYEQWANYKDQYRKNERALWIGKTIDLSEIKGDSYRNSVITGITPQRVRLRLKSGLRGVPYVELPMDMQDQLQFDADEAAEYEMALAGIEAQKDEDLKKWSETQREEQAGADAAAKIRAKSKIKRLIGERTAQLAARTAQSRKYSKEASMWRRKTADAKRTGKMSMNKSKVTEAEVKMRAADRAAKALRDNIKQLKAEEAKLR